MNTKREYGVEAQRLEGMIRKTHHGIGPKIAFVKLDDIDRSIRQGVLPIVWPNLATCLSLMCYEAREDYGKYKQLADYYFKVLATANPLRKDPIKNKQEFYHGSFEFMQWCNQRDCDPKTLNGLTPYQKRYLRGLKNSDPCHDYGRLLNEYGIK